MTQRAPRSAWRRVDGVLLLDKPVGVTSNAALQRVRRLLRAEKAGHTGTLDPLASGLLPLLFGEATKFGGALLDADKAYEAALALGVTTTTGDAEGAVLERRPVEIDLAAVAAVVARFSGTIEQIPPMHSALKHAGRPLYAYARAGDSVPRRARQVTIHELRVESLDERRLCIAVRCSKGTYVRTLAEDMGAALGCGAHLAALRRTGVGRFRVADAIGLDALERLPEAEQARLLLPVEVLVGHLPEVRLPAGLAERFSDGQAVCPPSPTPAGRVRVHQASGRFLGVAEVGPDAVLRPRRLLSKGPGEATPDAETL
jgi:tRNA pseudouridine55 synthase